jgi:hypothetical protein
VEMKYGYGESGGAYALYDDGNTAWEDEDLDFDDPETERIWKEEDEINMGVIATPHGDEESLQRSLGKRLTKTAFKEWRNLWKGYTRSFEKGVRELEMNPMSTWVRGYIHMGEYYDFLPPHDFFSAGERAIFRNIASWSASDDGWYYLPGPADWWPENYDFEKHGWEPCEEDLGQQAAFNLANGYMDDVPEEWDKVLPTEDELGFIPSNIAARLLGAWY